jgi:hypothetical protein
MSGWLFLAICTLICIGAFLNGLRFARMKANPFVGRKVFSMPVEGAQLSVASINRFGHVQMVMSPLFLSIVIALVFGLFGPVDGVQVIQF